MLALNLGSITSSGGVYDICDDIESLQWYIFFRFVPNSNLVVTLKPFYKSTVKLVVFKSFLFQSGNLDSFNDNRCNIGEGGGNESLLYVASKSRYYNKPELELIKYNLT